VSKEAKSTDAPPEKVILRLRCSRLELTVRQVLSFVIAASSSKRTESFEEYASILRAAISSSSTVVMRAYEFLDTMEQWRLSNQ
jgi:hypothetical protein